MIDIISIRQDYERRLISDLIWIPGKDNPADGMTKRGKCQSLEILVKDNQIVLNPNAWVEREKKLGTIA
jgi:hypothetical protein